MCCTFATFAVHCVPYYLQQDCQDESASASMFPTATPTVEIDDTNSNGVASTSTSTFNASDTVFLDSLPLGWVPVPTEHRTGEIIAISLVLALSICFVMACCVLWRKGTKRTKDVERRLQKQAASRDDLHLMVEKGIKSRQKTFARATARWKANARFTFRQRRGKRKNVQYTDNEAADSISQITPTAVDSPPASPSISPRSAFSSIPPTHISALEEMHDTPSSTTEETPSIRISSPTLSALHSPPAYPHDLRSSDRLHPALSSKSELASSPASNLQSRRSSLISSASDMLMVDHQSIGPLPYHHMGHVATDDKALLERLNQLISAPEAASLSTRDSTVLAPYWQDEELADFEHLPSSTTGTSSAAMFPPPPIHSPSSNEKGKGVESYSDEYSYSSQPSYVPPYVFNRDIMDIEPEAGPSAPPFEPATENFDSGPSAPPIELSSSEHASAPPLLSNDYSTLEDNH